MIWLRFPAGLCSARWLAQACLHGTGLVHAVLPWWLGSSAVIVLGAGRASRFTNTSFRTCWIILLRRRSFAVSISRGGDFYRHCVMTFLPFPAADVVIAFAPGSQDQMMLLALALLSRPGLCRRTSPGALAGGHLFDRGFRELNHAPAIGTARKQALETPGTGHVRRLSGVTPQRVRGP